MYISIVDTHNWLRFKFEAMQTQNVFGGKSDAGTLYTHMTLQLMRPLKMSFIIVWKVAGLLVMPYNITNGSNSPWLHWKAAFHSSFLDSDVLVAPSDIEFGEVLARLVGYVLNFGSLWKIHSENLMFLRSITQTTVVEFRILRDSAKNNMVTAY